MNTFSITTESIISTPENQYLDRKSARKRPLEILKHLIAFANADGGYLVIGVENNGEITGFQKSKAFPIEDFKNIARLELRNTPISYDTEERIVINSSGNKDIILIIKVDVELNRVITAPNDEVYLRQGDQSVTLSYEQRTQLIYDKGQRYFEDEIAVGSSLEDIDENIITHYKEKLEIPPSTSTYDLLKAKHFIVKDEITNAGILLFGKNPSQFLPQARLRFIKYDGNEMLPGSQFNAIKDITFDDALPILITKVTDYIRTQLRDFQYLDKTDMKFKTMPEYPEFAWFEGIINAVTHRNYSIRGKYIRVLMFDNRLEIHSPGLLPNIVTLKNIRNEQFSRNPRIARTLTELKWVREMNEGVKRIYNEMINAFLNEPIYSEPSNSVLLTLENNILNRHARSIDQLQKKIHEFGKLSTDEQTLISYMFNTKSKLTTSLAANIINRSPSFTRKLLKKLATDGLLEWHGSNINDKNQYYILKFPDNNTSKSE
ncbi:putative DNA binding domain-containing protein [Tuanshanicoccus lijuaniae]|uniref:ATP-binding protein n=1 Tax=Aerococcaceae bacterium zg-1292 TaxID=2774330 RepID=UPI0019372414|nr:putative DNA binding domain-containing protein [Aerococcaceae bacterium zg-1292]QQA37365.1 putative DNA binding domain-containing protein [Aerococcaceae bacterium zg-1292]